MSSQEYYNKAKCDIIENNLIYYNQGKHKNILSVKQFVSDGDRYKILKDNKVILDFLSLDECYAAIAGIINYVMDGI